LFPVAFLSTSGFANKLFRLVAVLFALVLAGSAVDSGGAVAPGSGVASGSAAESGAPSSGEAGVPRSQLGRDPGLRFDRGSDGDATVSELELDEKRAFLPSSHDYAALESQSFNVRSLGTGESFESELRANSVLVRLLVGRPGARAPPRA
jgi:hypothetical protein